MIDLRLDWDEKLTWSDGIVFQHAQTSRRLTFEKEKHFDISHQKVIERKPRHRIRKGGGIVVFGGKTTQLAHGLVIRDPTFDKAQDSSVPLTA